MRLPIVCNECAKNMLADPLACYPVYVELKDNGRYESECKKGHKSVTVIQEQKFEVLFELGSYALVDRYYREAVASFSSSLERYYEFFIKVLLQNSEVTNGEFLKSWKLISNQSERQLGAYIFMYCNEFKNAPPLLSNEKIRFRNRVVHKGVIPTRREAVDFGQAVIELISNTLPKLKDKFPDAVEKTITDHLFRLRKETDTNVSTLSLSTIISVAKSNNDPIDFEHALEHLKWWREKW